jgi:hypothetical protein
MEKERSSDILLIAIVLGIVLASGVLTKLEIFYESLLWKGVCVLQGRKDCESERKAILELKRFVKPFKGVEGKAKKVFNEVGRTLVPYQLAFSSVLLFLFLTEFDFRSEGRKKVSAVKLFDGELQNVVEDLYSIGITLTEEEVKALKKIRVDYSRLAGLLLLAFKKSNFNPSEISRRVKDEVAKEIIFSAGRPSIPPKVSLFFLQAEKKLSEVLNQTS